LLLIIKMKCVLTELYTYWSFETYGVGVEFNTPPDTIWVISEMVFTANHLTDTDKTKHYRKIQIHKLNTNEKK